MSDDTARFWSVVFGGVTAMGLVFGGVYSVIQYFDARAKDSATALLQTAAAQLEAKKPYYSKHLDLCSEASVAAATIATTKDPQKRKAASEDFWRLYWGPLGMVEETKVADAMVAFGKCLQPGCQQRLELLSLALAQSCRAEISQHFDLHLPPPTNKNLGLSDD